ncbi:MAG TPA: hypothetical protein VH331_14390 [Allosphingosinicella sp.]|jgi:hypothetical protein|nr:hypothetical protein [Allosphingosinicella sp.]
MGSGINKTFRDFETQAADRLRIAKQYGFDVVAIDKINAEQRLALDQQTMQQAVGSLQTLLSDLDTGDLAQGSLVDQIAKIKDQLTGTISDAMNGVDGAADKVAQFERDLIDKTKQAFGTAGPELAAAEDQAKSAAEQIIQAEQDRIKAAEDASKATNDALNENNDQNAVMIQKLSNIEQLLGGSSSDTSATAGIPTYLSTATGFSGQLNL